MRNTFPASSFVTQSINERRVPVGIQLISLRKFFKVTLPKKYQTMGENIAVL